MKVPLSQQIEEAERHRDDAARAAERNPSVRPRLDAAEGIVLTLHLLKTVEPDFRQYMNSRKDER